MSIKKETEVLCMGENFLSVAYIEIDKEVLVADFIVKSFNDRVDTVKFIELVENVLVGTNMVDILPSCD